MARYRLVAEWSVEDDDTGLYYGPFASYEEAYEMMWELQAEDTEGDDDEEA